MDALDYVAMLVLGICALVIESYFFRDNSQNIKSAFTKLYSSPLYLVGKCQPHELREYNNSLYKDERFTIGFYSLTDLRADILARYSLDTSLKTMMTKIVYRYGFAYRGELTCVFHRTGVYPCHEFYSALLRDYPTRHFVSPIAEYFSSYADTIVMKIEYNVSMRNKITFVDFAPRPRPTLSAKTILEMITDPKLSFDPPSNSVDEIRVVIVNKKKAIE